MGVGYPVAVDNDFAIWRAFDNAYWPALYVVDAQGRIRYHHFGEEAYERSERVIRQLLTEAGHDVDPDLVDVEADGVYLAADWDAAGLAGDLRRLRTGHRVRLAGRIRPRPQPGLPRAGAAPVEPLVALRRLDRGQAGHRPGRARRPDRAPVPGSGRQPRDGRPGGRWAGALPGAAGRRTTARRPGARRRRGRLRDRRARSGSTSSIRQDGAIRDRTVEITFADAGAHAYVFTFG